jgi:hypothetical protein
MKKSFVLSVLAAVMLCSAILAGGCQGYADVNDRVAATPASGPGDEAPPNGSDTGNEWYNIENHW